MAISETITKKVKSKSESPEMAEIITQEKLIELKEAKDKAMESDIPFPIVKGSDIAVVGDANKTELNKHDFVIAFIVPDGDGYAKKEVEYKDVWLKPRQAVTIQKLMTSLQPLFYKIQENGSLQDVPDEEIIELANMYEGSIVDQIYSLVAVVLGIDDRLVDYIDPESAMDAFHKIMLAFPDIVKASDSFFGYSSGEKKGQFKKR